MLFWLICKKIASNGTKFAFAWIV